MYLNSPSSDWPSGGLVSLETFRKVILSLCAAVNAKIKTIFVLAKFFREAHDTVHF